MTLLVFVDSDSARNSYWGTVNIPDEFLVGADAVKAGGLVHFFEPVSKTWTTMQSKGKGKGFEEVSEDDLKKQRKPAKAKAPKANPAEEAKRDDARKTL